MKSPVSSTLHHPSPSFTILRPLGHCARSLQRPSAQVLHQLRRPARSFALQRALPQRGVQGKGQGTQRTRASNPWWFMVIYGDLWWFMVIYGDLWWFMVIYGDLWWFMVIYFGCKGSLKGSYSLPATNGNRTPSRKAGNHHWKKGEGHFALLGDTVGNGQLGAGKVMHIMI